MKVASKVLLIITGILGILAALGFIIVGIIFLGFGANTAMVEEIAKESGNPQAIELVRNILNGFGTGFIIWAVISIAAVVLSFVSVGKVSQPEISRKVTIPLGVCTLILSVLSGLITGIIGGIFMLCIKENSAKAAK
ncbi:MAG: hypothetical protein MJ227_01400 [Bacilli bacterium]|nr:hypothetical protein [Bacilli bacterium]